MDILGIFSLNVYFHTLFFFQTSKKKTSTSVVLGVTVKIFIFQHLVKIVNTITLCRTYILEIGHMQFILSNGTIVYPTPYVGMVVLLV